MSHTVDPGGFETVDDEPWPCRIHSPAPPLLCTVRSVTQTAKKRRNDSAHHASQIRIVKDVEGRPIFIMLQLFSFS